MAKKGRERAPRDRRRPYEFPKPPCEPAPPKHPAPPRPSDPGCGTGPDPRKLLKKVLKRR